jgi:hypothetical protein
MSTIQVGPGQVLGLSAPRQHPLEPEEENQQQLLGLELEEKHEHYADYELA